jgi:hypothetical protein
MPDTGDEGFLARWSRLKRGEPTGAPKTPERADAPAVPASPSGTEPPATIAATDEPTIKPEELPNIDELTAQSDFKAFLQKGVPEELRRLALRKLWTADPAIRDFIEVAENQYDFNAGHVPGFGALAPDVDIGKLLAQATGATPAPAPPETGDTPRQDVADADASSQPPVGDATADRSAPPPPRDDFVTDDAQKVAELPGEQAAERPSRRRHGGALPG